MKEDLRGGKREVTVVIRKNNTCTRISIYFNNIILHVKYIITLYILFHNIYDIPCLGVWIFNVVDGLVQE